MNNVKNIINKYVYYLLIIIIKFYQKIISPTIPARCRYYPTCSDYGKQALQWHGVRAGSWLLLKRLSRCQPFGGHGIDFVPLPLAHYHYFYYSTTGLSTESYLAPQLSNIGWYVYRDKYSYAARLNYLLK